MAIVIISPVINMFIPLQQRATGGRKSNKEIIFKTIARGIKLYLWLFHNLRSLFYSVFT
jgi:hypothetical protein